MTFTYDAAQLGDADRGPLMQVRFKIGDVDEAQQHIQDEEIEYLLSLGGTVSAVASEAAKHIAMRYGHEASFSSGAYREELSMRAQHFARLAQQFSSSSGAAGGPIALKRYTREQDKASGRL